MMRFVELKVLCDSVLVADVQILSRQIELQNLGGFCKMDTCCILLP